MKVVKIKLKDQLAKVPVKMSEEAACYDVFAHSLKAIDAYKVEIGLGFMTEIPKGWKGVVAARSGITKTGWFLANGMGIVDSDYRGEWKMVMSSNGYSAMFPYKIGDRVGQIYFEPVYDIEFQVDDLSETVRGEGGFGSTGNS